MQLDSQRHFSAFLFDGGERINDKGEAVVILGNNIQVRGGRRGGGAKGRGSSGEYMPFLNARVCNGPR